MKKYQQIGEIALFKQITKKQANEFLKKHKQFRTVCLQGKISGKYRKPNIKVIAGEKNTETIHKDSGFFFKLDVAKIMWSKGNHYERQRMMKIVRKKDLVLDMFAGIGYWTIPIAKKVKKVYAVEINPTAFRYLEENIRLNRLSNIVTIKGDCAKIVPKLKIKANRIIMGLLPSAKKYIPAALTAAKKGTIIHYHGLAKQGKEKNLLKDFGKAKIKLLKTNTVKEYAPRINHVVLDIKVLGK